MENFARMLLFVISGWQSLVPVSSKEEKCPTSLQFRVWEVQIDVSVSES